MTLTVSPPVLMTTLAAVYQIKPHPSDGFWVKWCTSCAQLVLRDRATCECGSTHFLDPDDTIYLQFSGWELECLACHAHQMGLGMTPCECGNTKFRLLRPSYKLVNPEQLIT